MAISYPVAEMAGPILTAIEAEAEDAVELPRSPTTEELRLSCTIDSLLGENWRLEDALEEAEYRERRLRTQNEELQVKLADQRKNFGDHILTVKETYNGKVAEARRTAAAQEVRHTLLRERTAQMLTPAQALYQKAVAGLQHVEPYLHKRANGSFKVRKRDLVPARSIMDQVVLDLQESSRRGWKPAAEMLDVVYNSPKYDMIRPMP